MTVLRGFALGPARKVTRAFQSRKMLESPYTRYAYPYQLECGHIVERSKGGLTLCYCAKCKAEGFVAATAGKSLAERVLRARGAWRP